MKRFWSWIVRKHVGASHVPREVKILAWGMLAYGYLALIIGAITIARAAGL